MRCGDPFGELPIFEIDECLEAAKTAATFDGDIERLRSPVAIVAALYGKPGRGAGSIGDSSSRGGR